MSLTGIILDVSGSMQRNIGSGIDEQGEPWVQSIFKVIDDLIEHDLTSENRIFAIGIGASCTKQIFDVIGTAQQIENMKMPDYQKNMPATTDHINTILNILERNGARNIRKWAHDGNLIQDTVSDHMAALILAKLETDKLFLSKFVHEFLPSACREVPTVSFLQSGLLAILVKRGWTIDIDKNKTKLFTQVNHPDNLREVCKMAQDVCRPDALSELLVSVDLDIYISQSTSGFEVKKQQGGTCYVNASAAVLHLAMQRILGRGGGYPDFDVLKDDMIETYGMHGSNTSKVLQEICPEYRLHSQKVNIKRAKEAIVKKCPVVARFRLTDDEWKVFSNFYKNSPTGILTQNELNVRKRPTSPPPYTSGLAVVFTSYNSKCLTFMNSWGQNWADNGFFRVKNAEVLQLEFFDVYWELDDLTEGEKEYYRKHGSEEAAKLMKSLKGLQNAEYTCPKCEQSSLVTEFEGTLSKVRCPKCSREFSTNDNAGNILALNMYLTFLSR